MDELERQAAALLERATAPPIEPVRTRAATLRRRRRAAFAVAAIAFVAGAAALLVPSEHDRRQVSTVDDGATPTTQPPPTTTGAAVTSAVGVPKLPVLPAVGVAVQTSSGVELVGVDGTFFVTLPAFTLDTSWHPQDGVRVVRPDGAVFALDQLRNALVPAPAAAPQTVDGWPSIPPPPTTDDVQIVVGHWAWSIQSPAAPVRLAQWSGECEVPRALFLDEQNDPRSPFGGSWVEAPVSYGLGWTDDGRAIIHVPGEPACGTGAREGVYLVPPDGEPEFLVTGTDAQVWSPPRLSRPLPPRSWPPAVASQLALSEDAIGPVRIGDDAESAIDAISAVLGRPSTDGRSDTAETGFPVGECGSQIRYVTWGDLALMFNTEGGTLRGLLQWQVTGTQPSLGTVTGLHVGDSVATVRALAPGLEAVPDAFPVGGVFVSRSAPPNVRYELSDASGAATLNSLRGGHTQCIGD